MGNNIISMVVRIGDDDGTMRPGNKGVAFNLAMLPEVVKALQSAEAEARRCGLIG